MGGGEAVEDLSAAGRVLNGAAPYAILESPLGGPDAQLEPIAAKAERKAVTSQSARAKDRQRMGSDRREKRDQLNLGSAPVSLMRPKRAARMRSSASCVSAGRCAPSNGMIH
jgi:hypothetical protein